MFPLNYDSLLLVLVIILMQFVCFCNALHSYLLNEIVLYVGHSESIHMKKTFLSGFDIVLELHKV